MVSRDRQISIDLINETLETSMIKEQTFGLELVSELSFGEQIELTEWISQNVENSEMDDSYKAIDKSEKKAHSIPIAIRQMKTQLNPENQKWFNYKINCFLSVPWSLTQ